MWREFAPLWAELCTVNPQLLICGGYGLFLKQQWLRAPQQRATPTVVNLDSWRDAAPRVTKDIDLIVSVDVITDAPNNKDFLAVLSAHGYQVTPKNPRWQFEKPLEGKRTLVIELHCYAPPDAPGVQIKGNRVKHKPSLGEAGVHGRTNPEAIGSYLSPFVFEIQDLNLRVPNPMTWCVMKLTAMHEHWQRALDSNQSPEQRNFSREQALKHAQDVWRIIALTTRDERDQLGAVKALLASTVEFGRACEIVLDLYDDSSPIIASVKRQWSDQDFNTVRSFLGDWFSLPLII